MRNRVDLPAPFGPMIPTIAPFGTEAQVVDQDAVAVGFTQVGNLNDFIAQTRSRWDKQFVGFVTLLVFGIVELFKACQTGFTLRLTAFCTTAYPLQLFLNGFTTSRFLRGFLRQTLIFLLQPEE